MAKGRRICVPMFLTISLMLPLLSAAPLDPRVNSNAEDMDLRVNTNAEDMDLRVNTNAEDIDLRVNTNAEDMEPKVITNAEDDLKQGHEGTIPEQDQREARFSFDLSNMDMSIDISGSLNIQHGSIGHKFEINVNEHSHEHRKDGGDHHGIEMAVNGGYTEWSTFGTCSVSCGEGITKRSRTCTNPEPLHNGLSCEDQNLGPATDTKECNLGQCPVNGGYTEWSAVGTCSVSCGDGIEMMSRTCTNPEPLHNGLSCEDQNLGPATETKECNLGPCPVNGGYTDWSAFGACSKSCADGTQKRSRTCTNPEPLYNGLTCEEQNLGPDTDTKECNLGRCPDCSCSDFINKGGFGNCEKEHPVHGLFCWVNNPSNCSDLKEDSFDPGQFVSAEACTVKGSVYLLAGGDGAPRDMTLYQPGVSNLYCSTHPPSLNTDRSHHSTFYHDNTIYLCGGWYTSPTCISHTPHPFPGWKTHTLTTSRKYGHSTVVLQDRVYFIGGMDSSFNYYGAESTGLPLTDIPVFTSVPNLDYKGYYQCTARIDQDTLVITGGLNNGVYLSTASTYNSRTGAFTQLPQLKQARHNHGCGVWEEGNNKWIIVAGGFNLNDGSGALQTTEMLELGGSDSKWIPMDNLNVARGGHSVAVTERGVIVIGGQDASENTLSSVELLDWNTKTWSLVEPSLDKPKSLFGGAVELPASTFGCTGMFKRNEKIKVFDETIKAIRELKIEMQSIENELNHQETKGGKSSDEMRLLLHMKLNAIKYLEDCTDSDICEANEILELKEKAIEIFSKIKDSGTISEQFKEEFYDEKSRLDAACSYAEEAQTAKKDEVAKQIEEVKAAKEDLGSNKHDLL